MVHRLLNEFDVLCIMTARMPLTHHLDLYHYWQSRRGNHRMPTRRDIDPADIRPLLPHIALIEADRGTYRWRLMGGHIVEDFGCDLTGRPFGQNIRPLHFVSAMTATFDRVLDQGEPVFEASIYTTASEQTHAVSRLLLPLAAEGRTPAMIFLTRITRRRPLDRVLNYIKGASGQLGSSHAVDSAEHLEQLIGAWEDGTQLPRPVRVALQSNFCVANLWDSGQPQVVQCGISRTALVIAPQPR
jgi:hypothetical protein